MEEGLAGTALERGRAAARKAAVHKAADRTAAVHRAEIADSLHLECSSLAVSCRLR